MDVDEQMALQLQMELDGEKRMRATLNRELDSARDMMRQLRARVLQLEVSLTLMIP